MSGISESKDGILIPIRLSPRASKDALLGWNNDRLKISITSPPVAGKANAHLLKFLSRLLKVPRSNIRIKSGEKSRDKTVLIEGISRQKVEELLR